MPVHSLARGARHGRLPLALALLTLFALASPALAGPPQLETWHRLNPDPANAAPEHERLQCLPGVEWVCRYDKVAEPELEFQWNRTIAMFHGREVTNADCPAWLASICGVEPVVITGTANFSEADGGAFRASQELIFTDAAGVAPLYVHWVDRGIACPWHHSFADALAANPAYAENCTLAP